MRPDFDNLIEEFERLTLDEKIFLSFQSNESLEVQVLFRKGDSGRNWSIWYHLNEAASKQTISQKHLAKVLQAFAVSQSAFMDEICNVLLLQAAYADEFVREISGLLGEESVRRSIFDTQAFMDNLREAVDGAATCEVPKTDEVAAVAHPSRIQNLETLAGGKSRLRIVRS